MTTSLELKWMPPSKSKKLLKILENRNIVASRGGYIRLAPGTDVSDLPIAFRPSPDLINFIESYAEKEPEPAQKDLFPVLMEAAEKAGIGKRDFIQSSNRIQKSLGVDIKAAGLIALRDAGGDIGPYAGDVYRQICDTDLTLS